MHNHSLLKLCITWINAIHTSTQPVCRWLYNICNSQDELQNYYVTIKLHYVNIIYNWARNSIRGCYYFLNQVPCTKWDNVSAMRWLCAIDIWNRRRKTKCWTRHILICNRFPICNANIDTTNRRGFLIHLHLMWMVFQFSVHYGNMFRKWWMALRGVWCDIFNWVRWFEYIYLPNLEKWYFFRYPSIPLPRGLERNLR